MKKTLGYIPTFGSKDVWPVAEQIAPWCNLVLVGNQGSDLGRPVSFTNLRELVWDDVGCGVNFDHGFRQGIQYNYDYLILMDDDVRFSTPIPASLKSIMDAYPYLGALGADSNFSYYWSRTEIAHCKTRFRVSPIASQFVIFRVKALLEIVQKYNTQNICEGLDAIPDILYSARLWDCGWVVARTALGESFTYRTVRPIVKNESDNSGIPAGTKDKKLGDDISTIHKLGLVGDDKVLKSLKLGYSKKRDGAIQRTRYNYPVMFKKVNDRWGQLNYDDGRKQL